LSNNYDDLFSGRGSPALLSSKEPAIRLLKEKYSETFAFTEGLKEKGQVHLFLVKYGLWALVYTFTPRDYSASEGNSSVRKTLNFVEDVLGRNTDFSALLDSAVKKAVERIEERSGFLR